MNRIILILIASFILASCTNYGTKVKNDNIEVYYKEGITAKEAEKTAAVINELDGKGDVKKSFQLFRAGDTVTLRMVVDEQKAKGMGDENFTPIAYIISDSIFSGKPVNMQLTDNKFKPIRSIAYKKPELPNGDVNVAAFGERITEGNTEIYVQGAGKEEATQLAGFLENYFNPETTYSFQLLKDEPGNYTVKMVGNPDKINTLTNDFFEDLCRGICDKALSVPSVKFEMTDEKFNSLRTFNYPADTDDPDRNN